MLASCAPLTVAAVPPNPRARRTRAACARCGMFARFGSMLSRLRSMQRCVSSRFVEQWVCRARYAKRCSRGRACRDDIMAPRGCFARLCAPSCAVCSRRRHRAYAAGICDRGRRCGRPRPASGPSSGCSMDFSSLRPERACSCAAAAAVCAAQRTASDGSSGLARTRAVSKHESVPKIMQHGCDTSRLPHPAHACRNPSHRARPWSLLAGGQRLGDRCVRSPRWRARSTAMMMVFKGCQA